MKKLFIVLMSIVLLSSCADEKKEQEKESEALTFSTKTIEERLEDCNPEMGECTFISLSFPVAENKGLVAEKINTTLEKFIQNTIDFQEEDAAQKPEMLAKSFISYYKETAKEFPEYELPWEATMNGNVAYRSPDIVSIKFNTDMFTGGAHGYRSINYLNFDPKTGKQLRASDLFSDDFKAFVEKDFRLKKNIPAGKNINSTGFFFENDKFHLPTNIGVTENKVILHYNAYEIAPYSAGPYVMNYSKSKVATYLKNRQESEL